MKIINHSGTLLLCYFLLLPSELKAADFTNYLGMEFINIPKGSFIMGVCKESSKHREINDRQKFLGQKQSLGICPS